MTPELTQILTRAGERHPSGLWLVGGPVRDRLLGRPCEDWDMVCRGAKAMAAMVAKRLKAAFITLDDHHKIYRVIVPSSSGERPFTLDFAELQGRGIEEDLKRRDFTINAMALRLAEGAEEQVIDPLGGRRDLRRKTIRAVSAGVFTEDPLRVLRAFRFAAQFAFQIDPRTRKALGQHRSGLSRVSAERIREEFLRLLKQPGSAAALRLMDRLRVLSVIFPEIEACRRTAVRYYGAGGVLRHSFETLENLEWILEKLAPERRSAGASGKSGFAPMPRSAEAPMRAYLGALIGGYPRSAWLKWAAFLHDVGKPATAKMIKGRLRFFEHEHVGAGLAMRIGQRLRCSRQEVQLLGLWVRHHMRPGNLAAAPRITDKALSRFFRDLGENGVGMVLVSLADHYTYLAKSLWGKGRDAVEKISATLLDSYYAHHAKILPARLVDGHDLMKTLKLKPGPLIGKLLEDIQDAQAEGIVTTRENALSFAKKKMPRRQAVEVKR